MQGGRDFLAFHLPSSALIPQPPPSDSRTAWSLGLMQLLDLEAEGKREVGTGGM